MTTSDLHGSKLLRARAASGEAVLIEFPDTPDINFFRLGYRDVTTDEIFDYSGVGVRISSVVASPTSVLHATGQNSIVKTPLNGR